jgi:hypothetical protein
MRIAISARAADRRKSKEIKEKKGAGAAQILSAL